MKNRTTDSVFLFLTFLLICTGAFSQDYVVTPKGDTLKGEVKLLSYGSNSTVKLTLSDKKKITYKLFQVKSFFLKKEVYQPVKGPNGYTFMKLQKAGYLSLYTFQLQNQITYDGYYLLKMDGSGVEVPNLGFKKIMTNFLKDCDSVTIKIDNGDLNKRNLDAIIDEYNECLKNKTVDRTKQIAQKEVQTKKISSWDILEEKLKAKSDFDGKPSALEMITDIKGKIARNEKVPNFLTEGLKNILDSTELKGDLENALKEMQ